MTITLSLWMLFPGILVLIAIAMFVWGETETGMLAGCFQAAVGLACLFAAGAFLLGRWLS